MSARCDDCDRVVPQDTEKREGPYVDGRGRWHCLACIVQQSTEAEARANPLTAAQILYRMYGPQQPPEAA